MRCERCGKCQINNINRRKCWTLWKLCYKCAVEKHPEFYSKKIISMVRSPEKWYEKLPMLEKNIEVNVRKIVYA